MQNAGKTPRALGMTAAPCRARPFDLSFCLSKGLKKGKRRSILSFERGGRSVFDRNDCRLELLKNR